MAILINRIFRYLEKDFPIKWKIILLTGSLSFLVFAFVIYFSSSHYSQQLQKTIYHDLATKNDGYINTVYSTFEAAAKNLIELREDLELYDNVAQMWMHIAAHANQRFHQNPVNVDLYQESFNKKMAYFEQNGFLSNENLTPQLQKMIHKVMTNTPSDNDDFKFFYIGFPKSEKMPTLYHQYQDSSLWVPIEAIDGKYDPTIRPWFITGKTATQRNAVRYTEPYAEMRTKEALSSISTTIEMDGERGTLAAAISIKPIMDKILAQFQENAEISIFSKGIENETVFVSQKPKYLYSSRDAALGSSFYSYDDQTIAQDPINFDIKRLYDHTKGSKSGVLEWSINGEKRLVSYNTVPQVGWKLFISVSKNEIMQGAREAFYKTAIVSIIAGFLLLVIIYWVVGKSLKPIDIIGKELNELAKTGRLDIRMSVEGNNELGQVSKAINTMLDNTASPVKDLSLKVKNIAQGDLHSTSNIIAKGDVADLIKSFNEMIARLEVFEETLKDASPLTGLPGGLKIERVVQTNIEEGRSFAFCWIDLDNFKSFNDYYGYSRGNMVIKMTASVIQQCVYANTESDVFVGHIGGDDFVLVCNASNYQAICESIIEQFDKQIRALYDDKDLQAGHIKSRNRQGKVEDFPVVSITICAIDSTQTQVKNYIQVGEITAALKSYGKSQAGSILVVDRRQNN